MERCLNKLVLEAGATGFKDPEKGGWEPVGPSGRKDRARRARLEEPSVYSQPPEGQKTNSGFKENMPSSEQNQSQTQLHFAPEVAP